MQAYPLGYTDVAVVENARLFMKRLEIGPMDRVHRNKTRIAITDRTDSSDFFGSFFHSSSFEQATPRAATDLFSRVPPVISRKKEGLRSRHTLVDENDAYPRVSGSSFCVYFEQSSFSCNCL